MNIIEKQVFSSFIKLTFLFDVIITFVIIKVNFNNSEKRMKKNTSLLLFLSIACAISVISCSNGLSNDDSDSSSSGISLSLKAPVITPAAGDYSEGYKTITISNSNEAGDIYYTTDGKDPTSEDSRYTGAFNIIGSKTIKAIAIKDSSKSPVATAKFVLNAGKTQSQLGVVTGKVTLSSSLSEDDKAKLADSTVYIYSDEISGVVKKCKVGETYYFDGLDTTKSYTFFFSNVEPVIVQSSRAASAKNQGTDRDENGMPIVAKKIQVTPEEGAGLDVPVDLSATGKIKGTVKRFDVKGDEESDHSGTVVYIPGTQYSAYTDKDGNFVMSGVPQGSHAIRAQYAGYSFVEKENIVLKSTDENTPETTIEDVFNLYFGKGIVKGSVLLSDASSSSVLSNITVVITDLANSHSYTAATTASGSFIITDVYPGTYLVEISKEGYEDAYISEISVEGAKVTTIPTTSLQVIGGSLSGSVSINGKPDLSGISILAENNEGKTFFAITNSAGTFSWDKVSPGTYTISASYAGYKTSSVTDVVVTIGGTVDNIIVPELEKATYSITGKILLEGMESGFEGTSILIKNSSTLESVANTVTGTDGTFTVSDIQPGEYVLTITHSGYLTNNGTIVLVGTSPISVIDDIVLINAAGMVSGTVKMESAAENAGITILTISTTDSKKTYSTVTDSNGYYSIGGVTPGSYKVQATKSGFNNGYSDSFSVTAGTKTEISEILLSISQRSLFGTVTLEGKSDYAGIKITATNIKNPTRIYSALSNSSGIYALTGMTPGEYILTYSYEGYVTFTGSSISLESDSSKEVDAAELKKATGKITGIVNLEGCTDHSGILVSLVGTEETYVTESDGSYEFTVPSGNYAGGVRFSREDYQLTAKADTITVLTDSTYGVLTVEMKAVANTIKGIVDLAGNDDDSGIAVTIDEYPELTAAMTDSEGKWVLNHVPVAPEKFVTVRFTRVNTPDITTQIKVIASDFVEAGSIEMIPNAATLKGHAYLTDMTDNSGISVTVTTDGKDDIVTRTTSDGAFEITNILATGSHNVIFSKDGWESKTISINDLQPLEERVIGENEEHALVDITAPVVNEIILNEGANFTNSPKIEFSLNVKENGSGNSKMALQMERTDSNGNTVLYPQSYAWEPYKVNSTWDLSTLPASIYVQNGEYKIIVTVKDAAGNISNSASDSITITDQTSILKGVLTGDDLHLTKAKSPYRVEANILCQEGDTLVIEPGVQIEFAGDYYLKIDGCIKARGTESEHIVFTKTDDCEEKTVEGYDKYEYSVSEKYYWNGIRISNTVEPLVTENKYTYVSGCILEYCDIEATNDTINIGSPFMLKDVNIKSGIQPVYLDIDSDYSDQRGVIINSYLNTGLTTGWCVNSFICINTIIRKYFDSNVSMYLSFINCNFEDIESFWINYFELSINNCNFKNCDTIRSHFYDGYGYGYINNSNFEDCASPIIDAASSEYSKTKLLNLRNNYWGAAQTEELNLIGNDRNASFIIDYYDNFENTKVDYSNWAVKPVEGAGFLGANLIAFDYTINGFDFTSGSNYPETKDPELSISIIPQYNYNAITEIRVAQGYENLKNAEWQSYSSLVSFKADKTNAPDGYAQIYVQLKDSAGNVSGVVMHKVPFDSPVIKTSLVDGAEYNMPAKSLEFNFSATDNGEIKGYEILLDGYKKSYGDDYYESFSISEEIGLPYMSAGEHSVTLRAWDAAGNLTEEIYTFTITRTDSVPDLAGKSWDLTTGQPKKDEKTLYLWHLDTDGNESETGEQNKLDSYTHDSAGFNGSSQYIYSSGSLPVSFSETNAFAIEFWQKGCVGLHINKNNVVGVALCINGNNVYVVADWNYQKADGSAGHGYISTSSIESENWHYWCISFDGKYIAVYCDGILMEYRDGFDNTLVNNSDKLYMYTDSYQEDSAVFDELRISNMSRSGDEIKAYYDYAKQFIEN